MAPNVSRKAESSIYSVHPGVAMMQEWVVALPAKTGLALAKAKGRLPKRLISTGGAEKKARITRCIPITRADEVDAEVQKWLEAADQLDG